MRANLLVDLLSRGLGVLRLLLTPLILLPEEYGSLGLLSALLIYASFGDLGLLRQFEISSAMRPETLRSELRALSWPLLRRVFLSAAALGAVVGLQLASPLLGLAAFVYVLTFNADTLVQIILRHQGLTRPLALTIFLQAFVITALLAPVATWGRVEGVIWLQALAPLISLLIGYKWIGFSSSPAPSQTTSIQNWGGELAWWLLAGQALIMIWITADRLVLSRFLSPHELGLWNLGAMAGSVPLGVGNTWGTLKLPTWKRHPERFSLRQPLVFLVALWAAGSIGLILVTTTLLHKYRDGLSWNVLWLAACSGLALVFICDSYVRARIQTSREAKRWFFEKTAALLTGCAGAALLVPLELDPRWWVIGGISAASSIVLLLSWLKRKALP
jgi:hypothetical protein